MIAWTCSICRTVAPWDRVSVLGQRAQAHRSLSHRTRRHIDRRVRGRDRRRRRPKGLLVAGRCRSSGLAVDDVPMPYHEVLLGVVLPNAGAGRRSNRTNAFRLTHYDYACTSGRRTVPTPADEGSCPRSRLRAGIATIEFGHPKGNSLALRADRRTRQRRSTRSLATPASRVVVLRSREPGPFCAGASFDELQGEDRGPCGRCGILHGLRRGSSSRSADVPVRSSRACTGRRWEEEYRLIGGRRLCDCGPTGAAIRSERARGRYRALRRGPGH